MLVMIDFRTLRPHVPEPPATRARPERYVSALGKLRAATATHANGDEGNPNIRCPRCSESHANRIAGIEETGCLARARGQEGAASSARTFMSPSDRVFWAISAGEMMG